MNIGTLQQQMRDTKKVSFAMAFDAVRSACAALGWSGEREEELPEEVVERAYAALEQALMLKEVKKATKTGLPRCRQAMELADGDVQQAIRILRGEVPGVFVPEKLPASKGWTRMVGEVQSQGADLAVVAVRRKKLTPAEKKMKKELDYNGEHVGQVEDHCLCWLANGIWRRVTGFRAGILGFGLHDGRLVYAQNEVDAEGAKRARIFTVGEETHSEVLPFFVSDLRVGSTGMVVTTHGSNPALWAKDWGADWVQLPLFEPDLRRPTLCSADEGYWVCAGPTLKRFHDGEWRLVHTRGTRGQRSFESLVISGSKIAGIQSGEVWVGDTNELKPIPGWYNATTLWFEGERLIVEDEAGSLSATDGVSVEKIKASARIRCSTNPVIAGAGNSALWRREGNGWVEVPLIMMWHAVGIKDLYWVKHRERTWLPSTGLPKPKPKKKAPDRPATPSLRDELGSFVRGGSTLAKLQAVIDGGADLEERSRGETPLGYAVRAGCSVRVLELLLVGAEVDAVSIDAVTKAAYSPLGFAVEKNNAEVIELLLSKGASPSLPYRVVVEGEAVRTVSPLAIAARMGKLDLVKQMLEHKPDLGCTRFDMTPLAAALCAGESEVAELLKSLGAPIRAKDAGATSPLRSLMESAPEQVALYVEELAHDLQGAPGDDALQGMFLGSGKQPQIDFLLEHGARVRSARGVRWCIDAAQVRALELSLEAGVEGELNLYLKHAVLKDKISTAIVDALLRHGARPFEGDTGALFYAVKAGNVEVARLLIQAGADPLRLHYDPADLRADPKTAHAHAVALQSPVADYLAGL